VIKKKLPSPALVVAVLALFVALGGTAVAAGIVPHARLADNASKLQGKTAVQVAALAPKAPAATSIGSFVTLKTGTWTLTPRQEQNFTVTCDAGQKAIGGGWSDPGDYASAYQSFPTADGTGWTLNMFLSSVAPSTQTGTLYAVCVK
jgi:hypothetical protein